MSPTELNCKSLNHIKGNLKWKSPILQLIENQHSIIYLQYLEISRASRPGLVEKSECHMFFWDRNRTLEEKMELHISS